MDKLRELQQRFNKLVADLRAMQKEENPDAAKVANIEAELRALAAKIETERLILRTQEGYDGTERSGNAAAGVGEGADEEELRASILHYMRTGDASELRAMTTGTTAGGDTGGYLIPQSWADEIIKKARDQFIMRQICDVQISATDKNFPVEASWGASAWLGEGEAYTESDASFATKNITSHKVGRIIKVSEELLEDNQYDLVSYLTNAFAYSNGLAEEIAFIAGNGTTQPRGFLLDAETGVTAAEEDEIDYPELLDLYGSLKSGYDTGARWLMNKLTLIEIMKIKDGAGHYLFHPSTLPGELGHILAKPVSLSTHMPNIAADSTPIAYGDFKYYRIQDRTGFAIQRLNELYSANGQVGFRGYHRVDGKLLLPEAVKVLKLKEASGGGS
jgi:HK97 family phage major capsid protein